MLQAGAATALLWAINSVRMNQVPCSRCIRHDATDPKEADDIVTGGDADLVLFGRELLREPYWALKAQHAFEEEPDWPVQYGYAVKRRAK